MHCRSAAAVPAAAATALALVFHLVPVAAAAASVFRCTAADGSVAFQDRPCAAGERQQDVVLAPLPPPPPATADITPVPRDAPLPDPAAAVAPPAAEPPPRFDLCTRHDGSRYASRDGTGGYSLVPFGMLAGSGLDLAQAYGGRNGIGVSAPGLRQPPSIPAGEAPLAGAYVRIEDECHPATPAEACSWLRSRLDDVEKRLRRAFSDTAPALGQERTTLLTELRGCG
jgi:hypothetical protein